MPRLPTLITALALLITALACGGGGRSSTPTSSSVEAPAPAPVADVDLDCDQLVARIASCADAFEAAYAETEAAGRAGKASLDAEPDGPAGAKSFMIAFRHEHNRVLGEQLCESWAQRDPPWRARLGACDPNAECEAFAACAAPAIGDPLSRR